MIHRWEHLLQSLGMKLLLKDLSTKYSRLVATVFIMVISIGLSQSKGVMAKVVMNMFVVIKTIGSSGPFILEDLILLLNLNSELQASQQQHLLLSCGPITLSTTSD